MTTVDGYNIIWVLPGCIGLSGPETRDVRRLNRAISSFHANTFVHLTLSTIRDRISCGKIVTSWWENRAIFARFIELLHLHI